MSDIFDQYEPVIGLEIHAQLLTQTKAFCGCKAAMSDFPNTHVCPICLGHPGALPVMNKQHVNMAILMGLATHCSIRTRSAFSRKTIFILIFLKGIRLHSLKTQFAMLDR